MPRLEAIWEERNRIRILLASAAFVAILAVAGWRTETHVPLEFLFLLPVMLAAGFLPRWLVALLGLACAAVSAMSGRHGTSLAGFALQAPALAACGLLAGEWLRNRRRTRQEEQRLRFLVETIPAAILLVDGRGLVELANGAAADLVLPGGPGLVGTPIAAFFPDLHRALRPDGAPRLGSAMQCRGNRGNGESFLADVRCSIYKDGTSSKLAAIVREVADETSRPERAGLSGRETEVLRLVAQGLSNKEIASRMGMPESRVKGTLQQLFARTNVRTRAQLVKVALDHHPDIVSAPPPASRRSAARLRIVPQPIAPRRAAAGRTVAPASWPDPRFRRPVA